MSMTYRPALVGLLVCAMALFLLPGTAAAQGIVTQDLSTGLSAEQLADALTGTGVSVSNVTYTGAEAAAGTFSDAEPVIGFEGGVVLSSGDIATVTGPNEQPDTSAAHGQAGDPDLDELASADGTSRQTVDAAVLEFDFVPDRDQVTFDYVFASEEYNEYVGSNYNDVFGFFVNDTNCAVVGDDPVSVNTINNGLQGSSSPNPGEPTAVSNSHAYIDNDRQDGTAPRNTEMDGLTIVLQCTAPVMPNEPNHMKLAIADTSDHAFDSAVFLRAGSITTAPDVPRVSGVTRIETAVEVSELTFETSTNTVVIARADTYPDSLAGAPLARMNDAPILLTQPGTLHPATEAEINRLGATRAVLLGGTVALSNTVETQILADTTVDEVVRFPGVNRFETAELIAQSVTANTGATTAYIAEGEHVDPNRGWPDALAVSALAAYEGNPILLVNAGRLPEQTADELGEGYTTAVIVGGTAAVSTEVANEIDAIVDTVTRVSGSTRYDTGRAVADRAITAGMSPQVTYLASGLNFADALVGGPKVAADGGILLLVHRDSLDNSPATRAFLEAHAAEIETLYVLGGPAAVSDHVLDQVSAIIE